jgi:hypothetical protein
MKPKCIDAATAQSQLPVKPKQPNQSKKWAKRVPQPYPTNINGRCTIEKPESQIDAIFPPPHPATIHDETSQNIRSQRHRFAFGCVQPANRSRAKVPNQTAI